jgi:hypothetical protein
MLGGIGGSTLETWRRWPGPAAEGAAGPGRRQLGDSLADRGTVTDWPDVIGAFNA